MHYDDIMSEITDLDVLPAPENPHWDGETGIALWGHVLDSGIINNEEGYRFRLYRKDTDAPPNPNTDEFVNEGTMSGNLQDDQMFFQVNFGNCFSENGFYYFRYALMEMKFTMLTVHTLCQILSSIPVNRLRLYLFRQDLNG